MTASGSSSAEPRDRRFWRDRPVLITGATGLVGGWVVKRLIELEAQVVCLVRDWVPASPVLSPIMMGRVNIARGDITDPLTVERVLGEYEIQTVLHLAAQTIVGIANRNPVSTFESNVRGTWTVLEACRRSPKVEQIVIASSDKAYGDQPQLPYDERTPLQGRHPYDVSKSCADLIAQSYARTFEMNLGITRCGNFYGGGDLNWNRIIPGTIRSILRNERPVIRSTGESIRDYFYVEDGAEAYLLLAETLGKQPDLRGEAFNFSTGERLTVRQVVDRIGRMMQSALQPEVLGTAENEIMHQYLDATKARDRLGWLPRFGFEQGLERTIGWYRRFLAAEDEDHRQTHQPADSAERSATS